MLNETPDARRGSPVAALCAVYFFLLASVLIWTYIPRYLEAIGLSASAVGIIFAVRSLTTSMASPFWASAADRLGTTRKLTIALLFAGLIAISALPFTTAFPLILIVMILHSGTAKASLPLIDALTLDQVGSARYGVIRAWGSAGFGVLAIMAAAAGLLTDHAGLARLAPVGLIVLSLFAFIASLGLAPLKTPMRSPNFGSALKLLNRRALWIAFPIAALHWASQAPYNLFIVALTEERGFGAWVPGLAVAIGVAAEIIALANGPRLLRAFTPSRLLLLSVFFTALRWYVSGVTTDPAVLLAVQCLHGLSFGAFLVAMMAIIAREVAPQIRATGQAIFHILVFGVGGALGNALSGAILDHYTTPTLFKLSAALELGVFVLGLAMLPFLEVRKKASELPEN